ncbi:MAG TPA: LuxR C-terminal-related transcriptional regulator [Candidatus Alistipes excrementipullorum]|nr:LuxR C-terminal-related transcriptional regulator [Candidatus Alistipes excrementipullorum]
MNRPVRVVIAEPSAMVCAGLRAILDEAGGFVTAGVVTEPSMLDERLRILDADIAIINPSILDFRSSRNLRLSVPSLQEMRVVALVYGVFDDESLRQYDAVIKIVDAPSSIVGRLRRLTETESEHLSDGGYELTDREREILISVARGRTNKEIADEHNISIHTVISHRKNITRKTGIKSVAGLTVYALLNNMIDQNDME